MASPLHSLEGSGAGHPYGLKDKMVGKKCGLAEWELSQELSEKERVYDVWEKGQAPLDEYKDVMRSCREN